MFFIRLARGRWDRCSGRTIRTRERLVAVKLFKLDLPPERVHQLVAEFERLIAADLTHPALAGAARHRHQRRRPRTSSQDYVAADSLDLAVREYGPAPPADALRVAAQLAGALDFAAAVNVTHGALHPRDVLLSSDDTRLTGLGVTRALERVGVAAPVRRPYTAPERIAGAAWDRRADMFSLAALIHELLWGRRVSGLGASGGRALTAIAGARSRRRCATCSRARSPRIRPNGSRPRCAFAEALTRRVSRRQRRQPRPSTGARRVAPKRPRLAASTTNRDCRSTQRSAAEAATASRPCDAPFRVPTIRRALSDRRRRTARRIEPSRWTRVRSDVDLEPVADVNVHVSVDEVAGRPVRSA